ncbi:MAG TPA: RAMP superfamily CRISPR-associated protein [Thermoanaerobaculia bacterium]|nr:RAMP superfamily CRISPR-associated protein [Thermoanaerobaculia bacterium]
MRSFVLTVRPALSALALGGQTSPGAGADKATARDDRGRLVIPASALRGALRIELERLLRGRDGEGAACGANRAATADLDRPCVCPVCRLFGEEAGATGTLRLEDALWAGADDEPATAVAVRPHIGVSRKTGTVVEKLLGFVETGDLLGDDPEGHLFRATARLVPLGPGDEPRLAEDEAHLRAACAALNALGGGKARGLGWVECSLAPVLQPETPPARSAALAGATACELRFTAEAPLHLGQGRPIGFFQPTLRHAPGSTVRGALAFALLEAGLCGADDPGFRRLAAGGGASFGTARLPGEVPSETRRRCRPGRHVFDDLVGELVRRAAARRGLALAARPGHLCLQPGCASTKLLAAPHRPGTREPVVRVRTRTALNRQTGTAMDRKLYSLEVLEPRLADRSGADPLPLTLVATVRGLDPASAGLLAALDGQEVWLGGKRSKGMGRCRLDLRPERGPDAATARAAVESLHEALTEAWAALPDLGPFLPPERRPLAIVLEEPWAPEEAGARGPAEAVGDGLQRRLSFRVFRCPSPGERTSTKPRKESLQKCGPGETRST